MYGNLSSGSSGFQYRSPGNNGKVPFELGTNFYRGITFGTIGKIGTLFGKNGVSLESVVQTEVTDEKAQVVVVTHQVKEGDFRAALGAIEQYDNLATVANVLRVVS